jgi:hypothetical protein
VCKLLARGERELIETVERKVQREVNRVALTSYERLFIWHCSLASL